MTGIAERAADLARMRVCVCGADRRLGARIRALLLDGERLMPPDLHGILKVERGADTANLQLTLTLRQSRQARAVRLLRLFPQCGFAPKVHRGQPGALLLLLFLLLPVIVLALPPPRRRRMRRMRAKEEDAEKEDDGKEEAEDNTREAEEEEGYWVAASPAPPLSVGS